MVDGAGRWGGAGLGAVGGGSERGVGGIWEGEQEKQGCLRREKGVVEWKGCEEAG